MYRPLGTVIHTHIVGDQTLYVQQSNSWEKQWKIIQFVSQQVAIQVYIFNESKCVLNNGLLFLIHNICTVGFLPSELVLVHYSNLYLAPKRSRHPAMLHNIQRHTLTRGGIYQPFSSCGSEYFNPLHPEDNVHVAKIHTNNQYMCMILEMHNTIIIGLCIFDTHSLYNIDTKCSLLLYDPFKLCVLSKSSPWISKGVSATLQSGRYTLSHPRGRYIYRLNPQHGVIQCIVFAGYICYSPIYAILIFDPRISDKILLSRIS